VAFRFIAELAFGSQYSDLFLNLQQSLMAFNQTLKSLILYFLSIRSMMRCSKTLAAPRCILQLIAKQHVQYPSGGMPVQ
jgi:hypothetical protein